ncbi:hypothetical protein [Pseudomonas granadensis]|uniref:hypothetical protein n=1 Tax=Pseudomonas granadensis TaxID=1421430 RepID=UPI00087BC56D|nr:hypothetical protein [Pseudomonas granadensis]SDT18965.1 hypothetical protein SAMN05216579_2767 [Pseudomonas granadensis]
MKILKKLFGSKKDNLTQLEISSMPADLLGKLVAVGCTTPKHCYANCLYAVTNHLLAEKYVLCYVEIQSGEKLGHALIKIGDNYYDPTLEPQNVRAVKYWLHTEFSKEEVRDFVLAQHKDVIKIGNGIEIYPPSLTVDGKIVCEEIRP